MKSDDSEAFQPEPPPQTIEIGDVLDLHSFPPHEIGDLIEHYLEEAQSRGFTAVRIVHGKGIGVQKNRVRKILERHLSATRFGDAPGEAGGWGATWVEIAPTDRTPGQESNRD